MESSTLPVISQIHSDTNSWTLQPFVEELQQQDCERRPRVWHPLMNTPFILKHWWLNTACNWKFSLERWCGERQQTLMLGKLELDIVLEEIVIVWFTVDWLITRTEWLTDIFGDCGTESGQTAGDGRKRSICKSQFYVLMIKLELLIDSYYR